MGLASSVPWQSFEVVPSVIGQTSTPCERCVHHSAVVHVFCVFPYIIYNKWSLPALRHNIYTAGMWANKLSLSPISLFLSISLPLSLPCLSPPLFISFYLLSYLYFCFPLPLSPPSLSSLSLIYPSLSLSLFLSLIYLYHLSHISPSLSSLPPSVSLPFFLSSSLSPLSIPLSLSSLSLSLSLIYLCHLSLIFLPPYPSLCLPPFCPAHYLTPYIYIPLPFFLSLSPSLLLSISLSPSISLFLSPPLSLKCQTFLMRFTYLYCRHVGE